MSGVLQALSAALGDRYRIERELGRGGMATVFLAEDVKHKRRVAIKVLDAEVAAAIGRDRFLREIHIAARLNHPHILPLHDSGDAEGRLYYVMPYIEGESLRARLDRERQLSVVDAVRLAREIANGLGHAHHRGLVHRDIKPANILLSDGIALVADFGIARPVQPPDAGPTDGRAASLTAEATISRTRVGTVVGTPTYMAPEQILGSADVDARTDLYALGCVLYEMLAGQPPFTGPTFQSLAFQHLSVEPRPVTELRPDAPPAVVAILTRALAKAPSDRFATAARFAEALGVATVGTLVPSRVELATIPNNLPRERTSFVGRENELLECAKLLGESRLLSIIGMGGGGKTRLAIKLAENVLDRHSEGTWFVDLAPITSPEQVAQTVARALGAHEERGRPLETTIADRFGAKHTLLVLDNCEHLLSACAELIESLLSSCPELKILVTSREGLGVAGERVYPLRSLTVPKQDTGRTPRELVDNEAVRLFVERARMVVPDFILSAENAPEIAEICRRLDGIPLAIELAAARTKMLSLAQIGSMLDDRFRLLTGGTKALPRHQTLRATLQSSYDHLTAEMQRLFEVVAVFAGGWNLEAATAVLGESSDEFEVLDLMTGLVDKSLVIVRREGGTPRYRMLETMRQFGQERLSESGRGDVTRGRHLDFYVSLAERAEPHLYASDQDNWFRLLDQELENILAAHAWCDRDPAGSEKGVRLAGGLRHYWIARGLFNLGLRTTQEALARPSASTAASPARGRALYTGGLLAARMADYTTAQTLLEESVATCRALGDRAGTSRGLSVLGITMSSRGNYQAAHAYLEEAVASAEGMDKVTALNSLATALEFEGQLARAIQAFEEALSLARVLGGTSHTASTLVNLATARLQQQEFPAVRANLFEALGLSVKAALVPIQQGVLEFASALSAAEGESERSARLWGAADAMLERMGTHRDPFVEGVLAPYLARCRAELGEAAFEAACAGGRRLSDDAATAEARAWLDRTTTDQSATLASDVIPGRDGA